MSDDVRALTAALNAESRYPDEMWSVPDLPKCNSLHCLVLADAVEEAGDAELANLWRMVGALAAVVTAEYGDDWYGPRECAARDAGKVILIDNGRWVSWVVCKKTGRIWQGKGRRSKYGKRGALMGHITDKLAGWEWNAERERVVQAEGREGWLKRYRAKRKAAAV